MNAPVCWRCGVALAAMPRPWPRSACCPGCGTELYCCRQCRHYAPEKPNQCREPAAEHVLDKARVNRCEWFQPGSPQPDAKRDAAAQAARKALDDWFGG